MAAQTPYPALNSDILKTPGFFTAAIAADNENPFEHSFQKGGTVQNDTDPKMYGQPMNYDNNTNSNMFDFSPQSSPVQPSAGFPQSVHPNTSTWSEDPFQVKQYYQNPLLQGPNQEISPPDSAIQSPEDWSLYPDFQSHQIMSPLQHIVTQNPGSNPRLQYGQVTPPDDQGPDDGHQNGEHQAVDYGDQEVQPVNAGKRKRGTATTESSTSSAKRSRKSTGRSRSSISVADPSNPEGEKRYKFLERNRVAASKCRQKKKEWTSNLESRARELQNNKNQMALVVSSLREEVLFLKGELLKHTACGCTQIRSYLSQEAKTLSDPESRRGSTVSSIGEAPNSSPSSIAASPSGSTSPHVTSSVKPEIAQDADIHFKSEDQLEALLSSQLVHDAGLELVPDATAS